MLRTSPVRERSRSEHREVVCKLAAGIPGRLASAALTSGMSGRHERSRLTATIHGWLLLLPAMALLALFTHWPAVATFIDSFYSTPRPRRPARFVGLDNYAHHRGRPGVLALALEQPLFALGTIPVSIALAILMALWVNDRIAGRTLDPHGLLHADRAADDRGRQHLAVLLHAAIRPARAGHRRARLRRRTTGSARRIPRSPPSPSWRSGRKPASS